MKINTYLERCIDCRNTPAEVAIKWECLPVKSFGELRAGHLKAVTVGWNPALNDWLNGWNEPAMRAATVSDFSKLRREDLNDEECKGAVKRRHEYFWNPDKPIYPYFECLEMLLAHIHHRWSYVLGTVAHIDLVACPTTAAFGKLTDEVRTSVLNNCKKHFVETIRSLPDRTTLLFNGKGTTSHLEDIGELKINKQLERINYGETLICSGELKTKEKTFPFFSWDRQIRALPLQFKIELAHWIRVDLEKQGIIF